MKYNTYFRYFKQYISENGYNVSSVSHERNEKVQVLGLYRDREGTYIEGVIVTE